MKLIRIVNGTYGHKPEGSRFIIPTTAGDPPIMVSDEKARDLVEKRIAQYVAEEHPVPDVATPPQPSSDSSAGDNRTDGETAGNDQETAETVVVYSTDMKADELRAAMAEHGLEVKSGMTKAQMVEALTKAINDEQPPSLDTQDVVQ